MKTTQKSKAVLGPNFANVNYCLQTGFNIKTFKKFKLKNLKQRLNKANLECTSLNACVAFVFKTFMGAVKIWGA